MLQIEVKRKYDIIKNEKKQCYRIQWRENGQKKEIKRRYTKCGEEEAYRLIQEERNKLIKQDNTWNGYVDLEEAR